jgi:hypothetical protein
MQSFENPNSCHLMFLPSLRNSESSIVLSKFGLQTSEERELQEGS